jgi:GNAT superfamily N-acetyltransferase
MDYRLRACAAGDHEVLALIGRATFLETFIGVLDGRDVVAHCLAQHAPELYAAWLLRTDAALWLAETVDGAPVGYLVMDRPKLPVPDVGPGDVEVKRLYVLSRAQGTGVGAALMDKAAAIARQMGKRRLLLGVHEGNRRARAFYARHGFVMIGTRQFTVGRNRYDDAVLARTLDSSAGQQTPEQRSLGQLPVQPDDPDGEGEAGAEGQRGRGGQPAAADGRDERD